jgi:hypothetical protein
MATYNNKKLKVPYTLYLKYENVEWLKQTFKKKSSIHIDSLIEIYKKIDDTREKTKEFLKIKKSWDWEQDYKFDKAFREYAKNHFLTMIERVDSLKFSDEEKADFFYNHYQQSTGETNEQ